MILISEQKSKGKHQAGRNTDTGMQGEPDRLNFTQAPAWL
jgi:hypothetical protein